MAWDPISRSSSCPNAAMISPHGRARSTSPPGFVWRQVTRYRGQGFVVENKTVRKPRCVASAIGRRDHWAERYRAGSILPATIRPCRKIESRHRDSPQDCRAVLQCAASRYGLRRSGASYYETRYRERVVKNLHRRAKAFGFILQAAEMPAASRPFLRKVAALLGPQRRATAGLDGRRGGSGAGQRLDRRRLHSAGLSRASLHRRQAFRRQPLATVRPRPTPMRALVAKERQVVLDLLREPRFVDLAPAEVYAQPARPGRLSVLDPHHVSRSRRA